jgi:toxin CptA
MQRYYTLHSSRSLAISLLLLCTVSLTSVWLMLPRTIGAIVLSAAVLVLGLYHFLLNANLSLQHSCVAFRLEEREEIVLVLRNGKHLPGRVSHDSLVTPHLVILNIVLSEQRGGRSLVMLPDAMSADSFRRLRVVLRWGGQASQAAT